MNFKNLFSPRYLFVFVLALIFSAEVVGLSNATTNKIKMLVLYESLCPDSVRFMQNQLAPNYDDFKYVLDITMVPFGKSYSTDNGAHFFCQHGPKECLGNRQQSCMLNQTDNQFAQVKYAVCQMTSPSTLQECAEQADLSPDIESCMNSQLGTLLQLNAERITNAYNPSFIPTIIFNEVFDQDLQNNSLNDLRGTLCYILKQRGIAHDACN